MKSECSVKQIKCRGACRSRRIGRNQLRAFNLMRIMPPQEIIITDVFGDTVLGIFAFCDRKEAEDRDNEKGKYASDSGARFGWR